MRRSVLLLFVAPQLAGAALSSMAPKPSTRGGLRILEWIPSQQLLVRTARFGWNTAWRKVSAAAPHTHRRD